MPCFDIAYRMQCRHILFKLYSLFKFCFSKYFITTVHLFFCISLQTLSCRWHNAILGTILEWNYKGLILFIHPPPPKTKQNCISTFSRFCFIAVAICSPSFNLLLHLLPVSQKQCQKNYLQVTTTEIMSVSCKIIKSAINLPLFIKGLLSACLNVWAGSCPSLGPWELCNLCPH